MVSLGSEVKYFNRQTWLKSNVYLFYSRLFHPNICTGGNLNMGPRYLVKCSPTERNPSQTMSIKYHFQILFYDEDYVSISSNCVVLEWVCVWVCVCVRVSVCVRRAGVSVRLVKPRWAGLNPVLRAPSHSWINRPPFSRRLNEYWFTIIHRSTAWGAISLRD